jgi:hypothetical protein
LGAALATPTLARADDKPPVIKHNPIGKGSRGDTLTITAAIEDESAIFAPTLYYRYAGSKGYTNVTMAKKGDGYSATIPATAEVEYWIEAWDELGNGPSRDGSPDRPFKIAVPDKVAAAPKPAPAPPPPPKKVEPPPEPTPAPVAVVEAPPEPAPAPTPQPTVPPQVWDSEPLLDPPEPIYTQWWFYAGIGGAAAVVTGVLVYALQPAPIYQNVVSGTQLGTTRP